MTSTVNSSDGNAYVTMNASKGTVTDGKQSRVASDNQTAASKATPAASKPCAAPLVYVQPQKNASKSSATATSPILVKSSHSFHFSNNPTSASKIVLSQAPKPITVPTSKHTVTYFSMIKPTTNKTTTTDGPVVSHLPAGLLPAPTNQKLVVAPMSKIIGNNRLSLAVASATTASPLNFKITDGKLQTDRTDTVKIMRDSTTKTIRKSDATLLCTEVINIDDDDDDDGNGPNVSLRTNGRLEDKSYELSIKESPTKSSNKPIASSNVAVVSSTDNDDFVFTISIPDDAKRQTHGDSGYTVFVPHETIVKATPKEKSTNNYTSVAVKVAQREPPPTYKKSMHGISILKKNHFNFIDGKTDGVKATNKTDDADDDASIMGDASAAKPIPHKAERRRKSKFAYRKDYDEEIVTSSGNAWNDNANSSDKFKRFQKKTNVADITLIKLDVDNDTTTTTTTTKKKSSSAAAAMEDFVEIQMIGRSEDSDDYDIGKILEWNDDVGTLPGSKLKFRYNEFGMLEFMSKDDYKKMKRHKRNVDTKPIDMGDELRCVECGCYGMPSEFIDADYCSYDCQNQNAMKKPDRGQQTAGRVHKRRRKRFAYVKKHGGQQKTLFDELIGGGATNNDKAGSDDDDVDEPSNDGSHDKFTYPWQTGKQGFSWAKYLDHIKCVAAPTKLFKDPFPYSRNGFRPNMKLEGVDPQHPSYFCVLSVGEVLGYRVRLHFDGYPDNYDFWINADSMDIFPAGWCEKYNHVLQPPPGYENDFNWTSYLKVTKSTAAPRHLFHNRAGNAICPNGFRLGMKLEAVDRKNTSLVCVATITDLMDNRFLVHFDSWDDIYDYWADPNSPYIHPVGWCDQYGHNLTPPNDYPSPATFSWEKYLSDTKSSAAPVRAFKQRANNGFRRGMRIECVDRRVPQLIRVATVDDVREHQIRISFDGWPDRYSYWVDDDSRDIHPVGWCQKTLHPLDPPLTPDDVYDNLECSTVGCRGVGHIKGPKYTVHTTQKFCPYYEENIDIEKILPDRLLTRTPEKLPEAVVPVSREPREYSALKSNKHFLNPVVPKLGRPPKVPKSLAIVKEETWCESEKDNADALPKKKRKYSNAEKSPSPEMLEQVSPHEKTKLTNGDLQLTNGYLTQIINPSRHMWAKHSQYLNEYVKTDSDPRLWSQDEVVDFVQSLPSCKEHGDIFSVNKIDGEAFLMLTQQDLVDILNVKLGPAIKLYNSIVLLRQNISVYS